MSLIVCLRMQVVIVEGESWFRGSLSCFAKLARAAGCVLVTRRFPWPVCRQLNSTERSIDLIEANGFHVLIRKPLRRGNRIGPSCDPEMTGRQDDSDALVRHDVPLRSWHP